MIRIHPDLRPLLTDHEPEPHPDNPNMGDVDEIMTSLVVNGCYAPVHVSRVTNYMVKGHHLYLAFRELGETQWPITFHENMTWEDEVRMMLADNKTGKNAILDHRMEANLLRRLEDSDLKLAGTGYHDRELERMKDRILKEDAVPLRFHDSTHVPFPEDRCPTCGRRMD